MNRKIYLTIAIITMTIVCIWMVVPGEPGGHYYAGIKKGNPLPDSISEITRKSCISCHSDDHNILAVSKVDFSRWEKYHPKKQAKKAMDMCRMLSKGDMPPKSYREKNPGLIPSKEQVRTVCNWAKAISIHK